MKRNAQLRRHILARPFAVFKLRDRSLPHFTPMLRPLRHARMLPELRPLAEGSISNGYFVASSQVPHWGGFAVPQSHSRARANAGGARLDSRLVGAGGGHRRGYVRNVLAKGFARALSSSPQAAVRCGNWRPFGIVRLRDHMDVSHAFLKCPQSTPRPKPMPLRCCASGRPVSNSRAQYTSLCGLD